MHLKQLAPQSSQGQQYTVEVSTATDGSLLIAAFDTKSPESLLIKLPFDRSAEIMAEFDNDYTRMASYLKVINKRLVLMKPGDSL